MADSAHMTSHVIMSYLLWPPPASLACLSGPVAVLKGGGGVMGYMYGTGCLITPDNCKQVRAFFPGGGGNTVSGSQQGVWGPNKVLVGVKVKRKVETH